MTAMIHRATQPTAGLETRTWSLFLRSQARWLTHALSNTGSQEIVDTVLAMHDNSHGAWLGLIAEVQRLDGAVADDLIAVYCYHGRVAGSLERGVDRRLAADLRRQVRHLLARRLDQLTDEAVAMIEGMAKG